ncbi:hypothetical protein MASR2M70_05680 [Bacillota bacterium]
MGAAPQGAFGDSVYGKGSGQEQHYIVGFEQSSEAGLRAFGLDAGALAKSRLQDQTLETYEIIDGAKVLLTPEEAAQLEGTPGIAYIEPDYPVYALAQNLPWGISRIYEEEAYPFKAWDNTKGGGIGVAVLDTGIQGGHEDIPTLSGGCSTVDESPWDVDGNGHGTHVAGIVAAQLNDWGVAGVAPGVDLYSVKVLDSNGKGTITSIVSGIDWAVNNDIPIITMSLGTSISSTALKDACDAAYNDGHLIFAAAGNSGTADGLGSNMEYPAKYDSVIAVGATTSTNKRASFSSTGEKLELMAPGDQILSTYPDTTPIGRAQFQSGAGSYQLNASPLVGSGIGTFIGPAIFCGEAKDENLVREALLGGGIKEGDEWIALIDRGDNTFAQKVLLVMGLGAKAAVIINNDTVKPYSSGSFTLNDGQTVPPEAWIPAVSISYTDGQMLRDKESLTATVGVGFNPYKTMNGTSMAAPHAAAAAAMVWAKAPGLTNKQIRHILNITAKDLGLLPTQQGSGLIRLNMALEIAVDIEANRVFELTDWRIDEAEEKVEADLALKVMAGTEGQVICALYGADGRMTRLQSYPLQVTAYGQSLNVEVPWDPSKPLSKFKAFMIDRQQSPLGSSLEKALP